MTLISFGITAVELILGILTTSVMYVDQDPKLNAPYPTRHENRLVANFLRIFCDSTSNASSLISSTYFYLIWISLVVSRSLVTSSKIKLLLSFRRCESYSCSSSCEFLAPLMRLFIVEEKSTLDRKHGNSRSFLIFCDRLARMSSLFTRLKPSGVVTY